MCDWMTDVDYNLVVKCAKLSHEAYEDAPTCGMDLSPVALIDQKCWLFMDDSNDTLYIVFRGSDSICDLLINLNISHKSFKDLGSIHSGFYHYYKAVQKPIMAFVKKNVRRISNIVVTGHSLGGASAVLASLDVRSFLPDITCITFGTPPIADPSFVDVHTMLVPNSYRVINVEDWAPKLPIPGLFHVGKPVLLCTNNSPHTSTHCDILDQEHPQYRLVRSHGMTRYVACLNNCVMRPLKPRLPRDIKTQSMHYRRIVK